MDDGECVPFPDSGCLCRCTDLFVVGLVIDPFDSDHWLYGTGATIQGGHDLTNWDTKGNVSLMSLADGIEEESVQALIAPPSGPLLISAVGDDAGSSSQNDHAAQRGLTSRPSFTHPGFVHDSLDTPPTSEFVNPTWSTTPDIDYAGNNPTNIVRIGNTDDACVWVCYRLMVSKLTV